MIEENLYRAAGDNVLGIPVAMGMLYPSLKCCLPRGGRRC